MTPELFFQRALPAAIAGGHIWPEYACCEAAEESAWGESELARQANNLFGLKASRYGNAYPIIAMPTHEWENGHLVPAVADWPKYPDWKTSFAERMATLRRLAPEFPHYAAALAAASGEEFVRQVSLTWSTDPRRADNVLAIYADHASLLAQLRTASA